MSLSIMADNLHMLWIDLCREKPRNKWDFSKPGRTGVRRVTAYHLILKSIPWSNFHYFDKLWVLMPRRGLQNIWRGRWGSGREKDQRGLTVNGTLNTSRMSRLWHGALQDMLFVTWPSVYFKDRMKPEK